ncbi:MAG TPA: FMN-binding glutamate synthase family protein [Gammaproteobacteria bacterium]|nr:FMN-binding glutamate synthase family protein [Gammaproteobacteria bacterium]
MKLPLLNRFTPFGLCVIALIGLPFVPIMWRWPLVIVAAALVLLGLYDLLQGRHAIRRNYPVIGNLRYLLEAIRPEIRQYMLEGDREPLPFSREQRALVYRRAKNESADKAFGSLVDVYRDGFEFMSPSLAPVSPGDPAGFRVDVGGPQCRQPYSLSVFNISAMSFGALSGNAIQALNQGAALGGFAHDTGEGGISPYHRRFGGDLIWELGSGYFGCRDESGSFDPKQFRRQARERQVKMIEIKLSQGAKPGHGGVLPRHKISAEIAATRGIPRDRDCVSPPSHSEFSTPLELMEFIARLRELADGKPVGFKLCVGHPWEFMAIAKAMLQTGILPDFIVVDGAEGGTGAAPLELADHMGMPLREALLLVHNTLVGANLREHIRIGASGKLVSAFDIAAVLALGADWANSARSFMFAIGCIQAQACHTNRCPTGVATQDPLRQRALVVPDKAQRVYNYHRNTLRALAELLASAGLEHPAQIQPEHLARRVSYTEIRLFSQLHHFLQPGELLTERIGSDFYTRTWRMAQAESFSAAELAVGEVEPRYA